MTFLKKITLITLFGFSTSLFSANACKDIINNETKVLGFAYEAMLATYNYNFVNYQNHNFSSYYSKEALDAYQKEYNDSKVLDKVINNKLVVSVGAEDSPVIVKKGMDAEKGVAIWQVQIPLLIHYHSADSDEIQKKSVTMNIVQDESSVDCLKIQKLVR